MLSLCLESSTNRALVVLAQDGQVLDFEKSDELRSHAEFMNAAIDRILKQQKKSLSDIDLFFVGRGPGSFTGIRVALNIAKTFSAALKKPIASYDTLELLASVASGPGPVMSVVNAFKNMVYVALYENHQMKKGPLARPVSELKDWLPKSQKTLLLGNGFAVFQKEFQQLGSDLWFRNEDYSDLPEAESLARLAKTVGSSRQTMDWNSILPLYIRASEAEEKLRNQ